MQIYKMGMGGGGGGEQPAIEILYPCQPQPIRDPLPVKIIYTNVQGHFVIAQTLHNFY